MNLRKLLFWKKGKKDPDHIKTVGLFTGYFFIINFVVGTGFLGIPYSFYNGGILAGAITLIIVSFVSGNTAVWTVESMARAQVIPHIQTSFFESIVEESDRYGYCRYKLVFENSSSSY